MAKRIDAIRVRAYIFLCRDLPAGDKDGSSDSYLALWDASPQVPKTKVIDDDNNPLFYEVKDLYYEVDDQDDLESYPPFIFDLYDKDTDLLDSTDDFLGRATIEPEDCALITQRELEAANHDESQIQRDPRWHPFYFAPGAKKFGEVLVKFIVVSNDYKFPLQPEQIDLNAMVPRDEYNLDILVLGLRKLQSPGILPVKKAFINFKCKSVVPPGTESVRDV